MPVIDAEQELTEQLQQWNPMQDAYMNAQFNKYITGPAANLGPALETPQHPIYDARVAGSAAAVGGVTTGVKPYLVFKKMPADMTKKALYNMCIRHGRVSAVRDSTKNDYFFADFDTAADQEAVYRALERNIYGFTVIMGKGHNDRKDNNYNSMSATGALPKNGNKMSSLSRAKNPVDMESRSYRSSDRHPPRPYIKQGQIVTAQNYAAMDSLLQHNDPQRHFLIESDAHDLERAGLQQTHTALIQNDKCSYRTGRAYIEMPEKMQEFVNSKHLQSAGKFDAGQQHFQHAQRPAMSPLQMGTCAECQRACDFVCYRCATYYCGVDCQSKAWPDHRFVCGKPKHVQMLPHVDNTNFNHAAAFNNDTSGRPGTIQHCPTRLMHNNSQVTATDVDNTPPTSSTSATTANNKLSISSTTTKNNSPQSSSSQRKSDAPLTPIPETNMPRSGNLVTLTSISKTNVVFIRSKTYEDNMTFFETISEIQASAKSLRKLQAPLRCGQIVIALFKEQYNRAMILNADELERIKLIYIDYGNLDAQTISNLYEAPEKYIELPRLAIPVILKDVPDCYMTTEIRKFMYSYLDGIDLILNYKIDRDLLVEKGVYCVELIDEATNKSMNKMIAKLCKPLEPTEPQDIYYRDYIEHHLLPAGEQVEFMVMDNSLLSTGCISCTTKEYALEIQKFQQELQSYAESLGEQNYAPRVDELCIAKYSADQKWYRGRCLDLVGDGHPTIVFFDYGNIAFVSVKDIRRYPSQFTYPVFTSDCEIDGLPEHCNDALVSKLEKLIPNGSIITCAHVEIFEEDNFYSISLPHIIENLRKESLLEPPSNSN